MKDDDNGEGRFHKACASHTSSYLPHALPNVCTALHRPSAQIRAFSRFPSLVAFGGTNSLKIHFGEDN